MQKKIAILIIALFAIPLLTAKNSYSIILTNNFNSGVFTQGGVLEFSSSSIQRIEESTNNCDSVILRDYSGLPLKALQLKIIIGSSNGKLKLKYITRGSSIPASLYLFDYEIYRGEIRADGSSIDEVRVVILGNGENVILPQAIHHILSINYDVVQINSDIDSTSIELSEVLGATCTPVQDANISVGNDKTIYLNKLIVNTKTDLTLNQNYPNPFNPNTSIQYIVSSRQFVTLKVYDVLGNEIETLVNEEKPEGVYEVNWNAASAAGGLPSGVYFYQVSSGNSTDIKKMILIK